MRQKSGPQGSAEKHVNDIQGSGGWLPVNGTEAPGTPDIVGDKVLLYVDVASNLLKGVSLADSLSLVQRYWTSALNSLLKMERHLTELQAARLPGRH